MRKLIQKVKKWYSTDHNESASFQIECECGSLTTGKRKSTYQTPTCSVCGRKLFVLPQSSLPPVASKSRASKSAKPPARWKTWFIPISTVLGTLVVLLILVVFFRFPNKQPDPDDGKKLSLDDWRAALQEAESRLRSGQFRLAANQFDRALPNIKATERSRWLSQAKQAKLLADLLTEPLETVVRHAIDVPQNEWLADFPHRFAGKSVLFDLQLRKSETGSYEHDYAFVNSGAEVRLAFEDIHLLKRLPLDVPRRILFGARLASIRLESPGPIWTIRFRPDSGVLMTEYEAVVRCCPNLSGDEMKHLLKQQKEWAD